MDDGGDQLGAVKVPDLLWASFAMYQVGKGWRCNLAEIAISTSQGVLCQEKSAGEAACCR